VEIRTKMGQKRGQKLPKKRRQVGAFCKKWPGYTGTPFIFWPFFAFFRFFVGFRGWCNITPKSWVPILDLMVGWYIWLTGCWVWLLFYTFGY